MLNEKESIKELLKIPGVGISIANDLRELGYEKPEDLKGESPQSMYDRSCEFAGVKIDRCLLYVYKCAVYYAENDCPDPELLKWWNWKDKK